MYLNPSYRAGQKVPVVKQTSAQERVSFTDGSMCVSRAKWVQVPVRVRQVRGILVGCHMILALWGGCLIW